MDRKNITVSTIRDTLDDAGIDVADDVIEEGTPQDEVMKVVQYITVFYIIYICINYEKENEDE